MTFFNELANDEQGATAIEYGLIAALVAVGLIVSLNSFGTALSGVFNRAATQLNSSGTTTASTV